MNILFLAAEASPFIKIGGLADVAGSLPDALQSLSSKGIGEEFLEIRMVIPFYKSVKMNFGNIIPLIDFFILKNDRKIPVHAYQLNGERVPIFFINGEPIRADENVYSLDEEKNKEKFTFFSVAALELARIMDWKVDIIHANDWHTSLALYSAKVNDRGGFFNKTNRILTIHNLPYLGGEAGKNLKDYGLIEPVKEDLPDWARTQFLPLGISAAEKIITVSETYAKEILTPDFGCGLHEYFLKRNNDIVGIINGLDQEQWDPADDNYILYKYDIKKLEEKVGNKQFLLKELQLPAEYKIPLIGMVTRIDYQKGVDMAIEALSSISDPWLFILLGSGDPTLEEDLKLFEAKYPNKVRVILKYDYELSHRIYAGIDIFLMPSRYEPCGLSQMIALRYGSVPVVRATGGLKDTVSDGITGFLFDGFNPEAQANTIKKAINIYSDRKAWKSIQKKGMQKDFSWNSSAKKYAAIYNSLYHHKNSSGGKQ